ncbi:MAG TPA: outer membrane beta-barrel protein [Terriglobales bacterium]|nr:outer membrane beta-barrel protein [Terriglobales bacterium]
MRKVLAIALLLLFCGVYTVAQDYPKAQVFGGFSYLHVDTEGAVAPAGTSIKRWYPGWEIAGQFNLTKMLGVKADFSGNYGTPITVTGLSTPSARTYSFLFGPVVSFRGERATPFVHALFGGNHIGLDSFTLPAGIIPGVAGTVPAGSETSFAMAFGGGLDVKLTRHFGLRVGQFDYLYTKHCADLFGIGCLLGSNSILGPGAPAAHQNNFRFATGVVIQ